MSETTVGDVLEARRESGRVLLLWTGPGGSWLGEDEDRTLFRFPAEAGGWSERVPVSRALIEGRASVGAYNAVGTGWVGLTMPQ